MARMKLFDDDQKCGTCAWWESGSVGGGWCRCMGKKTAENAAPCEWMTPSAFTVDGAHGVIDLTAPGEVKS